MRTSEKIMMKSAIASGELKKGELVIETKFRITGWINTDWKKWAYEEGLLNLLKEGYGQDVEIQELEISKSWDYPQPAPLPE